MIIPHKACNNQSRLLEKSTGNCLYRRCIALPFSHDRDTPPLVWGFAFFHLQIWVILIWQWLVRSILHFLIVLFQEISINFHGWWSKGDTGNKLLEPKY